VGQVTAHSADRLAGCLLGGAVGDALGANVEFDSAVVIRRRLGPQGVTGYVPGAWPVGAVTDDTQMTLFTAEGLLRARTRGLAKGIVHVPTMIWLSYLRWLHTQGEPWPDVARLHPAAARDGWLVAEPALHASRAPGVTVMAALRSGRMGTAAEPANDSKGCGG
jgi:ADP-ribosyl-[dinitrogen reductase] hydrolase